MNISEFNINDEFIACNHITTNELNPLVEKPYHTKASIFALCTKGVLKTIINHTQFRVEANALLVIPPETFVQLLHTDYVREHQVSYYALKMNMRPAALCRLVKKESGYTAMEIINNTIIMDAKAQLCTANTPIKDIAVSLGFNNAAFFNKFFKRHTGIPPQKFRTSSKQ